MNTFSLHKTIEPVDLYGMGMHFSAASGTSYGWRQDIKLNGLIHSGNLLVLIFPISHKSHNLAT